MMMVPMHLQTFSPKSVRPVRGICMFDVPTKQFQHPARAGPTTSNLTLMCHRIANAWLNFHSFFANFDWFQAQWRRISSCREVDPQFSNTPTMLPWLPIYTCFTRMRFLHAGARSRGRVGRDGQGTHVDDVVHIMSLQ